MIFSVISFSLMDISVKLMSSNYPIGQLVFFRGFLGLIPIFFIIPLNRYKNLLVTTKLKLHIGRAVAGTFAMVNLYLGLKFLPIADAITISFAAPIFAASMVSSFLAANVAAFGALTPLGIMPGFADPSYWVTGFNTMTSAFIEWEFAKFENDLEIRLKNYQNPITMAADDENVSRFAYNQTVLQIQALEDKSLDISNPLTIIVL